MPGNVFYQQGKISVHAWETSARIFHGQLVSTVMECLGSYQMFLDAFNL